MLEQALAAGIELEWQAVLDVVEGFGRTSPPRPEVRLEPSSTSRAEGTQVLYPRQEATV